LPGVPGRYRQCDPARGDQRRYAAHPDQPGKCAADPARRGSPDDSAARTRDQESAGRNPRRGAAARQFEDDEQREYTDVIISETDRLAGLVDTLLGPGGPPNKKPVNIHELVEYVLRIIEAEQPTRLDIRRDYDPGLPEIPLDRDQMVQAFLNLVRNAAAALNGQGKITLRSRAVTNFTIGDIRHRVIASIEIEDDGPGIPYDLQDSVFYPLVTSRPEGTGLGLPAAQELISRHGGLIEFDSRPGRTIFYVRIPLLQEVADDQASS
jgi:two-component system nitrogen regulation sensor histidine kinase GlnL